MVADFHLHTTASDGDLDPAALVAHAASHGIHALAITDHDTLGAYRWRDGAVFDGGPPPGGRADGRDRARRRPRRAGGAPARPRAGPRGGRPRRAPRRCARRAPREGAAGAGAGARGAGGARARRGGRLRPRAREPDAAALHPAPRRARPLRDVPGGPRLVPRARPGRGRCPQAGDGRGDRDDPRGREDGRSSRTPATTGRTASRSWTSSGRSARSASTASSWTTRTPPARPSCSRTATPGLRRRAARGGGGPRARLHPRAATPTPGRLRPGLRVPAEPARENACHHQPRRTPFSRWPSSPRRRRRPRPWTTSCAGTSTPGGDREAPLGSEPAPQRDDGAAGCLRPLHARAEAAGQHADRVHGRGADGHPRLATARSRGRRLPLPGERPRPMGPDEAAEARAQADVDLSPLVDAAAKGYSVELGGPRPAARGRHLEAPRAGSRRPAARCTSTRGRTSSSRPSSGARSTARTSTS